ncbi:MAG: hypothetical protein J5944_09700, partial [Lentisphaeria bacterium]|nr:hypothetical protein [Lentisphaeria bacterium]
MQRFHLFSLLLLFLAPVSCLNAQEKAAETASSPAVAVSKEKGQPPTEAAAPAAKKKVSEAVPQPVYPEIIFSPLLRAKQDPETFADPARAAELFLAREKLIQNLLTERRRILTSDPKAREIHAQIMELNKQLAAVLEGKRAVREITRDLMLVDARINALKRKAPDEKPA